MSAQLIIDPRVIKPTTSQNITLDIDVHYDPTTSTLIVRHPVKSQIPKFIRIKSIIDPTNPQYKISQYRIHGVDPK